MAIFPSFCFRQESIGKCPYDILERKNAFLGCKKKELQKSRKIDIFLKGLTHGFGPKMGLFPTFSFLAI